MILFFSLTGAFPKDNVSNTILLYNYLLIDDLYMSFDAFFISNCIIILSCFYILTDKIKATPYPLCLISRRLCDNFLLWNFFVKF